jgi:hypothetical protein
LGQKHRRRGTSTAAGGGSRGGAVSGEDAARVDKARAGSVEQVLGEVPSNSHGAGYERSKGFGGGSNGGRRRTGGRTTGTARLGKNTTTFYTRGLGVTAG